MGSARRTWAAREGLLLMSKAVVACGTTAFSGVEYSQWWGPAGRRVWLADIWHRPGSETVAEVIGGTLTGDGQADAATVPDVSIVISLQQLDLLQSGYVLVYQGSGTADGRTASIVAAERPDGKLAAKFWLDQQTRLPLRRQLFDTKARIVSDISFTDLQVGPQTVESMPAPRAMPLARQLDERSIAALRAQGWPLPGWLPSGMMLFAASQTPTKVGPVMGLSYSDGLSVISLFVQRGQLPADMTGWKRVAIGGQAAYTIDPDEQTVVWSGNGYVFTMIADAPAETVDHVVAALPHSSSSGFWDRLERGFRRLASWVNPFR
jgi:sigma-E factor negative regulatory protein RseB